MIKDKISSIQEGDEEDEDEDKDSDEHLSQTNEAGQQCNPQDQD